MRSIGKMLFNHIRKCSKHLFSFVAEEDNILFSYSLKQTTSEVGHWEICFTIPYQNTEMEVSLDSFLKVLP